MNRILGALSAFRFLAMVALERDAPFLDGEDVLNAYSVRLQSATALLT